MELFKVIHPTNGQLYAVDLKLTDAVEVLLQVQGAGFNCVVQPQ